MRSRYRGAVSAFALLVMAVVMIASIGAASYTGQSMLRAKNEADYSTAFELAQAGSELGITKMLDDARYNKGKVYAANYELTSILNTAVPSASISATVLPDTDTRSAWVTSSATFGTKTRGIRVYARVKDVGVWNNAIFAGTGAAGRAINGNVDIRGSVHILGDGEAYNDLNGNGKWDAAEAFTDKNKNGVWDPGEAFVDANGDGVWNPQEPYNDTNGNGYYDPALTQTDLNSNFGGNAYIGNNYDGIDSSLLGMIPTPPSINGIQTLSTEVRVKHGQISVGGSATVGTSATVQGGSMKNTIDGSFVSDGYVGNQGAASVFSDNGTSNAYDLGSYGIEYPLISGIGAPTYVAGSTTYVNQATYLSTVGLLCPVTTITSTTTAFSFGPDAQGNSIKFTPASGSTPAVLTVTGIIKFASSVQIGAKDSISFKGSGSLYSPLDINIDGNFLPAAGVRFPDQTAVGLIANRNINLATGSGSSQLSLAGAFYAQGQVKSAKQNQILGTIVGNFFDMGTNVPKIYQVPDLATNLPPGMPGKDPILTLKLQSWRER